MKISRLKVSNLRNLEQIDLHPHDRLNIFYGVNGAGKTSILEAITVLSRGRSFRSNRAAELIGDAGGSLQVFAEFSVQSSDGTTGSALFRQGIERSASGWKARLNGEDVDNLGDLATTLPVVVLEPNSHLLVSGSPDTRRRFLDWGVFHVEPEYLVAWRRYARALKQRNTALRRGQEGVIASLEAIMAPEGEAITERRARYVTALSACLASLMPTLNEAFGALELKLSPGWAGGDLAAALESSRARDLERGATQNGPHRADLEIRLKKRLIRGELSRGEQKLLATAMVLAQAQIQCDTGRVPVLLLDDLASEFDQRHLASVMQCADELGAQTWVTGVDPVPSDLPQQRFHVEHGKAQKVV